MNKKRFYLYTDYKKHLSLLSLEQKGQLMDAIFAHAEGEDVELTGVVEMAFSFIAAQMDRDNENYELICEKRRESGAKGGLAKASKAKQKLAKASKSSKSKDIDIDIDIDIDKDIDKEKVKEVKTAYGEYAHVKLTKTEYQKMISDFGQDKTDKAIKFFDEYIEDKGYKSKSHNLAMRRWVFKAVEEQEHKQGVANGRGNNITISAPNSRQRADYEEVDKLLWG